MYPILEKKTPRRGHLADASPRTARRTFGATRAVRHRPRRRARRTHPAHDLGLRPRAGQRHHRDAGHRRLDSQNMLAGCGRCLRRFRRPAGTPLGIREDAARRAPQAALPLRGGRRGHRPGLPPGQMAPRARRRGRCHHRCQDPRHAHLHRRHACRGRKPLHRHRRRFGRVQGARHASRRGAGRKTGPALRRMCRHRAHGHDEVRGAHHEKNTGSKPPCRSTR